MPRGHRGNLYRFLADGEVREITTEKIQEIHGGSVQQFVKCLRAYAIRHGFELSVRQTWDGLKFCMGEGPLLWQSRRGLITDRPRAEQDALWDNLMAELVGHRD